MNYSIKLSVCTNSNNMISLIDWLSLPPPKEKETYILKKKEVKMKEAEKEARKKK